MVSEPPYPGFRSGFIEALGAIETPAVLVDRLRLDANIQRIARLGKDGVAVRPHAKTHKSIALAQLQLDAGAIGLTVAKPSEAEVFLAGGVPSVTIAYPLVVPAKIERVARVAAGHGAEVRFLVDSDMGIDAIAGVARTLGATFPVHLKVDVGLHRCGVAPDSAAGLALARRLAETPGIAFAGLLSHAGHAYRTSDAASVRSIAETERMIMTGFAERLAADGIGTPDVSVGCTPTVILNAGLEGISEIRPGNYVYMDRIQVALGAAMLDEVALWVAATVVSVNDRFAIVDAGSKVLSSDLGPHGSEAVAGYGMAWRCEALDAPPMVLASLSEEHGVLDHGGIPPRIGERVALLPNHSCPVVNLADEVLVIGPAGDIASWPVDARGKVR
ncbi:MAG: alanine racemase [Bauldia sp.]|nr:alanine racemase [Bauldia sp.]